MKVALIGYGKMGHAIEEILIDRGHSVVCTIDVDDASKFDSEAFRQADVAIEFSRPEAAEANVRASIAAGVPVVSGTTGWKNALTAVGEYAREHGVAMMWSSNFSIGVNIFMEINKLLARLMAAVPQYHPSMTEVHHIHKLDHPSGTAITLAEDIMESHPTTTCWQGHLATEAESDTPAADAPDADTLEITSLRSGEVPGIHTIEWNSPIDTITISHSARSRRGFALGAVMAAEWLAANPAPAGLRTMQEFISSLLAPADRRQ